MLSRRRATAVVSANWWDGGRLEHLVGPLAPNAYVALALHTPWLLLCTLHGFRTLPMAFALHTPWAPYTSHGFGSGHRSRTLPRWLWLAHSLGSEHSHRLYCVVPRRHITKIASPFRHSQVQEAQRHVKPPPRDDVGKGELVGRRSA